MPTAIRWSLLVVLSLSVAGCSQPESASVPETPSVQQAQQEPPIAFMDPMQKQQRIASNFPLEVPVPEGEVVRGEAQGEDAWDYEIIVNATSPSVAEWYRQALVSRSWVVTSERPFKTADGVDALDITLQKGGGETRVTLVPEKDATRVSVVLGVGTPVVETQ